MIRSESEYKNAVERVDAEKRGLADREAYLREQGFNPDEVDRAMSALRAMHQNLVDDVELYVQIKRRDFDRFESLHDLARLLVAGRVASGLTGREFASKLGVNESQVSRDERNEYNGVTIERACMILEALELEVELKCKPSSIRQELEEVFFDAPEPNYEPATMEDDFGFNGTDSNRRPRRAA